MTCGKRRGGTPGSEADDKVYNLIQLIYHAKSYEGTSKDYEFSRLTMEEHWRSGYNDAVRTLRHPEVLQRPNRRDGVVTFDLAVQARKCSTRSPIPRIHAIAYQETSRMKIAQVREKAFAMPLNVPLIRGGLEILQPRIRRHHLPHGS